MRLLSPDSGDCPSTVDARTWYLELWELTNDRRTDEFHTFLLHSSVRQDIRGGRYVLICAGVWYGASVCRHNFDLRPLACMSSFLL